jgi:carbonic anhydrase
MKLKNLLKQGVVAAGLVFCINAYADAEVNNAAVKVKWSYVGTTGPAHWGMLSSAFELCDTGKMQSPINLGRKRTRSPYDLSVHYHPTPMYIGENLDTNLNIHGAQTITNDHGLQLNFHDDNKETITLSGKDYELLQFHFHSPSETLWHKQAFPLEIHFVHQGKDGELAVIGVFVKGGEENPVLQQILDHLPEHDHEEYPVKGVNINPGALMPANQRYFYYMGSLTTPPCAEGVQWIVMPEPITASPAQILKIRKASGGTNARPVQPMYGRALYYSVK